MSGNNWITETWIAKADFFEGQYRRYLFKQVVQQLFGGIEKLLFLAVPREPGAGVRRVDRVGFSRSSKYIILVEGIGLVVLVATDLPDTIIFQQFLKNLYRFSM